MSSHVFSALPPSFQGFASVRDGDLELWRESDDPMDLRGIMVVVGGIRPVPGADRSREEAEMPQLSFTLATRSLQNRV